MLGRSILTASLDARHKFDLMPPGCRNNLASEVERLLLYLPVLLAKNSHRNHFWTNLKINRFSLILDQ